MEVLLLTDIPGVGRKTDLIVVASGYALNHLLPQRKAIVVTPNVRRQYAEQMKHRALEREKERELQVSLANAVSGKIVRITAKAGKAGKLYAAVSEQMIVDALMTQFGINIPAKAIAIKDHIKNTGNHIVMLTIGAQSSELTIDVKTQDEKAVKAA